MKKNLLVAQSGGPSVAINATVSGVVECGFVSNQIDRIYGAVNGIQGVLQEHFVELNPILSSPDNMQLLCQTPAAALGSCRLKLLSPEQDESLYEQLLATFRKYNIGYFIYIGGNDSMDTVMKLSGYLKDKQIDDVKVIGAPKTIDNDLAATDHCPGFGSAAKYIATTMTELERDRAVYHEKSVTIVEVMGRNAGWLTASAALARSNGAYGPQLIYLCEKPFELEQFLTSIEEKQKERMQVLVAVSEGVKGKDGQYISEETLNGEMDVFGHKYIAGVGSVLENAVRKNIGCKVRAVELNLMQRCSSRIASATDIYESRMLGMKAVSCALEGECGKMTAIRRLSDEPYCVEFVSVDIAEVANLEKTVPLDWIAPSGYDVTEEMVTYLRPLIEGETAMTFCNGIPKHITLY